MNALRQFPAEPMRSPASQRRRRPQAQPQATRSQQRYQAMALESGVKVGVNLGISVIALSTLVHLLPYRSIQAQKLKEVQAEVQRTEVRVGQLQADFDRASDKTQIKSILQEQTHMVDPTRKALVFDERAESDRKASK